ncbi:putative DNA-binding protein [Halanaerobium sp. MA284_MarDTE_T2]|nr:putative DNA-binding protein [Halanaerobium sp. MA284_MarDTE_T2]
MYCYFSHLFFVKNLIIWNNLVKVIVRGAIIVKSFKEKFSRFFEQPTRKGLREILRENYGELDSLDFKGDWPSLSKMGKHLLAFANSGGGCIIVGVMEKNNSLYNKGLENMLDKSTFHNGVEKYIPQKLNYEIINFNYEDSDYSEIIGKSFQVLVIEDTPQYIPFISQNDGDGIKKNNIYIRKGTKSLKASYEDLQKIINKKIETNYSTDSEIKLEEHLS